MDVVSSGESFPCATWDSYAPAFLTPNSISPHSLPSSYTHLTYTPPHLPPPPPLPLLTHPTRREVCEFSTVEEFWKYWSFIPRPSEVLYDGKQHKVVDGRTIDAFSVFKKGIRPEWEDPLNRTGAEFTWRKTMTPEALDAYWENLVLGLIGETIDADDDVCGCRVVDKSKKGTSRTMFRLELWVKSGNQEIADKVRVRLGDALTDGEASKPGSKIQPIPFEFKRRAP